tara:strand:+ start:115 stop:540 length:426 start_codon:yes stop_codon:yes gene_type:complete
MPLVGGGGSPNVTGGSAAGVGSSLNYIGNHAYGYSGTVSIAPNSLTSMLKFNTANNSYVVGTFQLEGDFAQVGNDSIRYQLLIDSQVIFDTDYSPSNDAQYADSPTPILLPPNSSIEIKATHSQGGVNIDFQAMIIGEVYA